MTPFLIQKLKIINKQLTENYKQTANSEKLVPEILDGSFFNIIKNTFSDYEPLSSIFASDYMAPKKFENVRELNEKNCNSSIVSNTYPFKNLLPVQIMNTNINIDRANILTHGIHRCYGNVLSDTDTDGK